MTEDVRPELARNSPFELRIMNNSKSRLAWATALALVMATPLMVRAAGPAVSNIAIAGAWPQLSIIGVVGTTNQIQTITDLSQTNWVVLTNITVAQSPYVFMDTMTPPGPQRFYRVMDPNPPVASGPAGMVLIPAGTFQMGDTFGEGEYYEQPIHDVYVSAFYMDKYETTKGLWDDVAGWGSTNGYSYDYPGSGKATNHPVQSIDWYDAVKWCNARSEKEGRVPAYYTDAALTQVYRTGQVEPFVKWNAGYRLPTEAEWEKGDRGGATGHRFPWTDVDTISHSQANYYSDPSYSYDVSPTRGYNPAFVDGVMPYTSPVGSFAPNGYGLYDTAGNVWEWCWDHPADYTTDPQTDPHGADTGSTRVGRGGNWNFYAEHCRDSYRYGNSPTDSATNIGFRSVLPAP
jgi:formylglycine-generating enzyme required for sulfatase activity